MDVDTALSLVGVNGRWHVFLFCLGVINQFIAVAFHSLIIIFIGWEPRHFCNTNYGRINSSAPNIFPYIHDYDNFNASQSINQFNSTNATLNLVKCHEYKSEKIEGFLKNDSITLHGWIPCENGWSYDGQGYIGIVEEWDLVCDRNYMAELSQIFFIAGCVIGDLFLSFLVDKYGRKTMIVVTHIIICIIGVINSFSVSYLMFALLRIPIGMFCAVNLTAGTMANIELFATKHRTKPGILTKLGFIVCYATMAVLAYFIHYWRHLQLAVSVICGSFALVGLIMPESVPWLYYKGRLKEAEDVIRKMATYNRVMLEPGIKIFPSANVVIVRKEDQNQTLSSDGNHNNQSESTKSIDTGNHDFDLVIVKSPQIQIYEKGYNRSKLSLKNVLTDKILLKFLAILGILWFTTLVCLHSIMLSSSNLGRNRFINYLVFGALDIPMVLLTMYLCTKLGRCTTIAGGLITGGILSIIKSMLPPDIYGFDLFSIGLILLLLAKECYSSVFTILLLYTKELFPTQLRSTCNGICLFWGRLGNLLSPLSIYLLKTPYYWVPNIVNGSLAVIVGFTVFLLPETMNRITPETIEDCHKLDENSKTFKGLIK